MLTQGQQLGAITQVRCTDGDVVGYPSSPIPTFSQLENIGFGVFQGPNSLTPGGSGVVWN